MDAVRARNVTRDAKKLTPNYQGLKMPPEIPDFYRTIANSATAEPPKTKGSRFIGKAVPVGSVEEALEALKVIRKREYNATHNCWAYRVGQGGDQFRYSDDGEPNGSAGLPIYREIEGRDLTNMLVVVTRHYGGTKLGTGGLVRAYGEAAGLVLDDSTVVEVIVRVPVRLSFGFADTSPAMHVIGKYDAEIAQTNYTASGTELLLAVRRSEVASLESAFVEALGGRGTVEIVSHGLSS